MDDNILPEIKQSFNLVPSCLMVISPSLSITLVNHYFADCLKIDRDIIINMDLASALNLIFNSSPELIQANTLDLEQWLKTNNNTLSLRATQNTFKAKFEGMSYNIISGDKGLEAIIINFGIGVSVCNRQSISEREMTLQNMTDDSEVLISIVDEYGNLEFRNLAWEKFMGDRMPSEGRFKWEDLVHEDDLEPFHDKLYEAISTRASFSAELRMKDCDNLYRWLKIKGSPRINAHQRFLGYICTGIEISEIKNQLTELTRLNEALLFSNAQIVARKEELQSAFDAAEMGSCSLDIGTLKAEMSKEYRNHYGLPLHGDIDWQMVTQAVEPEYREEVNRVLYEAAEHGTPVDSTYPIRHLVSGERKWMRVVGKVNRANTGIPQTVYAVVMDVTSKMEEDDRKNKFIEMVSHELKTPLTSIGGFVQLLTHKYDHGKQIDTVNISKKIQHQLSKMGRLIEGFLNISRIESAEMKIEKKEFNFCALINELNEEFINDISTHTITAPKCESLIVNGDKDRIGMVIHNLISNAIKYSASGSEIQIEFRAEKHNLVFSVRDQGIGIVPGEEEKLFGRYFRSKNQRLYTIAGFGIGLYICAQIIKLHGGRIWAERVADEIGSKFSFSIPQSLDN
ncbi:ATP-binding protein [Pedobacter agri]|uniref:PAS domain-containing sensor histidine kinase n=1 Tax=Pedobacter agri TaxID=454586 RepID=UPI00292DD186|nr:ATP-binding protein [Pedobacter agri]